MSEESLLIRILHIITDLETGGAETMLFRLLSAMDRERFENRVICLTGGGRISEKIAALGLRIDALGLRRGRILPAGLLSISKIVRSWNPAIIQTWLYHSDMMGWISGKWLSHRRVIWNLRCSYVDFDQYPLSTRVVKKICGVLSPLTDAVVANSNASYEHHARYGYHPRIFETIHNGLDTSLFVPDVEKRKALRGKLGIGDEVCLVGIVGRFDHMKGYEAFCEAAGSLQRSCARVQYVMCGRDIERSNALLRTWMRRSGIEDVCHLMGHQDDMNRVYPGMDIAVSSSIGEGFPNVIAEAMACGVPCVVTDVGDSAYIVGDTGMVVPAGDTEAMAAAWGAMAQVTAHARREQGLRARERICSLFHIRDIARKYEALYERVMGAA